MNDISSLDAGPPSSRKIGGLRQELQQDGSKLRISKVLHDVDHASLPDFALLVFIEMGLWLLVARRADDLRLACDVHQVLVRVIMTQRTVVGHDLDREGPYKLIREDEVMPRLMLDRDNVLAGILVLGHGYSFEGLNSTTIMRMSSPPVLVRPWSG